MPWFAAVLILISICACTTKPPANSGCQKPCGFEIDSPGWKNEDPTFAENLSSMLLSARAIPEKDPRDPRKTIGFRFIEVAPGMFWHNAGIRQRDLLLEVNGKPADAPMVVYGMYSELAKDGRVDVKIERDGKLIYLKLLMPERKEAI